VKQKNQQQTKNPSRVANVTMPASSSNNNRIDWGAVAGRRVPYWFTLVMTGWVLMFLYVSVFEKGGAIYDRMATSVRRQ
jgi:hypothetical protein